ncbi:GNAT family N-acetyltransferase [Sphingoaurantiacus capsulatus]|uniref:GNAT family N-acetyltransferase n=1 Tax=Sphingoaurantiacus capsulatus TaxID=1771310 RepID=A0ABV7X9T1_9SPHN
MLTTARLLLRPPTLDDVETLQALNEAHWPLIGNRRRTLEEMRAQTEELMVKTAADSGWSELVVEHDGRVIGRIAINRDGPGERQAELGYGFFADSFGQGLGPEAVGRVLTHLFGDMGLHRVIAITGMENNRSRRLLEKLGFRLEGEMIEAWFHQAEQRFVDEVSYAILAREWRDR